MSADHAEPAPEPERPRVIRFELARSTIFTLLVTIACVWLAAQIWPIALLVLVALMLVGTLLPFVRRLESRGISRPLALVILFLIIVSIVGLAAAATIPVILGETATLMSEAPAIQQRLVAHLEHVRITMPIASALRSGRVAALLAEMAPRVLEYSTRAIAGVAYAITTVFLALYLIADRERIRGVAYAFTPKRYHLRLARVLLNLETIVGGYVRGQIITSAAIALFVFTLLTLFRVHNAIALGVFAGLTDVLPFIGGILAITPAALAALSRGAGVAIAVVVCIAIYQEFENRVLVPRVYGRVLRLPPAAVMVAILVGGKLLGIVGALLALPIAAAIRMVMQELRVELPGDDQHADALRARDARMEALYAAKTAGAPAERAAEVAGEFADQIRRADASSAEQAAQVPVTGGEPKKT